MLAFVLGVGATIQARGYGIVALRGLHGLLDRACKDSTEIIRRAREMEIQAEDRRKRIVELEQALRPFAGIVSLGGHHLTTADLQRARDAFAGADLGLGRDVRSAQPGQPPPTVGAKVGQA